MRTLIPIALLVGSIATGSRVHSATDSTPAPTGSLSGKTYLGTFEPAAETRPDTGDPGTAASKPEPAATQGAEKRFDVKNNFRNICSFCHADYGRKAGRGPQLMDSPRSDQFLFDRIKHGLTGRMPGFGGSYSDAQINQFVKFIRSLKPGEDPKNPA